MVVLQEHVKRTGPALRATTNVALVVYRTPVAELRSLFDLLERTPEVAAIAIFDNGIDPALEVEVLGRGWIYQTAGRNIGFGSAHNRLFEALRSQSDAAFHLLLNPDIGWTVNPVTGLTAYLVAHARTGAVMPDVISPTGERQFLAKRLPTPLGLICRRFLPAKWTRKTMAHYELRDWSFEGSRTVPIVSGCFMLLRSEAFLEVGGFDEGYFLYLEDYDLCRRLTHRQWDLAIETAAQVVHAHNRTSYSLGRPLWWHIRSAIRYFRRWGINGL
ncbi:hypothetical protein HNQ50_003187 [Silvimonas terrae]|uniref:Glycosyltransferase 2-like domain-containing protein n=1 Tax=Silvimonas terrae TaxID=300266 RepID=A0A840RJG4_9NEIS|nr:glycosyltransferase family 2 protein [Silvimonas terrae]MBB5192446.1 hypothetical protein [Silvimonas terrae]